MQQNGLFSFIYKQKWVIFFFHEQKKIGYFHKAGLSIRICKNWSEWH